jgi:hypothetical protein
MEYREIRLRETEQSGLSGDGRGDEAAAWDRLREDWRRFDSDQIRASLQEQLHRYPLRSLLIAGSVGALIGLFLRRR